MPTVVDINVHDMGIQAATLLLRKIRHPEPQVQAFTTMPVLKVRTTTASSGNGSLEKELMPAGKRVNTTRKTGGQPVEKCPAKDEFFP